MLRHILRPVLWERVLWDLGGKETGVWYPGFSVLKAASQHPSFRSTDEKDSSAVHCLRRTHSCWGPGTFFSSEDLRWREECVIWAKCWHPDCLPRPTLGNGARKGSNFYSLSREQGFQAQCGMDKPCGAIPLGLEMPAPQMCRELIAEVATPCELLQRQLRSSPPVHVINQQLLLLCGTWARPPPQYPVGTFQVCSRQLTGRRSFCNAWLKGLRAI